VTPLGHGLKLACEKGAKLVSSATDGGAAALGGARALWQSLSPLRSGVGARLLTLVLLFSSVVTLVLTSLQLYLDYRRDVGVIEDRLADIRQSYLESLGESLWNLDEEHLRIELEGILSLPDIRAVEVRETPPSAGSLIVRVGTRDSESMIERDFPLVHDFGGVARQIGTVHVDATLAGVYRTLARTVLVILLSQAAKTFLVSLFILYVVHRLITRRLVTIANFVRGYDLRRSVPPLHLPPRTPEADELDQVAMALNEMIATLRRAYDELRAANDALAADNAARQRAELALREAREQEFRHQAQKIAADAERLDLLRQLVDVQEQERLRIARELHDQMGQDLAGLSLGLKSLEAELQKDNDRGTLRWLQSLTAQIGRNVHQTAWDLRPTSLDDVGLVRALQTYVADWGERFGIRVDFHAGDQESSQYPADIETAAYRVVQEALTNVLKHAAASTVSLVLECHEGALQIIVEDDGKGFDPEQPGSQSRLGLAGMRERLAIVGGTLTIDSEPTAGTTLYIRIPLRERRDRSSTRATAPEV
jgi:signal transduction histidine kinase